MHTDEHLLRQGSGGSCHSETAEGRNVLLLVARKSRAGSQQHISTRTTRNELYTPWSWRESPRDYLCGIVQEVFQSPAAREVSIGVAMLGKATWKSFTSTML